MAEELWALVIEDDPDSASFTKSVLERHAGMRTVVATDGPSALVALQEQRFDLVVSDIEMPGMSGLDLLPDVHRLAPGVPVIVLTAYGKTGYAIRALRGEADEFLIKPVSVSHLAERALTLARQGSRSPAHTVGPRHRQPRARAWRGTCRRRSTSARRTRSRCARAAHSVRRRA
ncbi:MAG: response regulator [Propionibacteriaceae bacterium]|nr:response regulator [Propionibacteriaceae bacterium]